MDVINLVDNVKLNIVHSKKRVGKLADIWTVTLDLLNVDRCAVNN